MSTVTSDCWGIVCFFKFMGLFAKGELSLFNKVSCFFRLETENVSKGALVQCAKRFFWLLMPAKQFTTLENFYSRATCYWLTKTTEFATWMNTFHQ